MRNTITVMNAKGGVGKSTLVLGIAETLSTYHRKKVLVIDSDAQASISHMLTPSEQLDAIRAQGRTIVEYLIAAVLKEEPARWEDFVVTGTSDVDDARSIDLVPSDTHLTLFEREVSKRDYEVRLRKIVRTWVAEAKSTYDLVLIDSAPGLSVLTECWLREADFYLSPTKPDHISTRGLKFLRQFRQRDPDMGFAEPLGVIVNMKDLHSTDDEQYDRWLRKDAENRCFPISVVRASPLQAAGHFSPRPRSYWAKYPGNTGDQLRQLTADLLSRVAAAQKRA
ncbi:MAG: ParA family protein [Hyphomicrobiaceae bacterium]|nr:MAG: ParA family protein [Hyphomicrobiaceae bacterium]